jgi:GDP-4-dehydro-6-deoxy-D-mannose reductase
MRSALVTGAQGFIGQEVVASLRAQGVEVTTIGRRPSESGPHIIVKAECWTSANLALVFVQQAPDVVFHLAGMTQGTPTELDKANVCLAETLMQGLEASGLRPLLVLAGSAAEYGAGIIDGIAIPETTICKPLSPYGTSKYRQTLAAQEFAAKTGTPLLVARIFNPLGAKLPKHLALADFASQIAAVASNNGILRVGNLDIARDFIDVRHVGTLLSQLAADPAARGIINICSGEATRLCDLVEKLIALSCKKIAIETEPKRLRATEVHTIFGSTALLEKFGAPPPPTDYADVVARVWQSSVDRTRDRW